MNIGVSESWSTQKGQSLQRRGVGLEGHDFSWQSPSGSSRGAVNSGQSVATLGTFVVQGVSVE
jgi:hypothetical protein